MFNEYLLLEFIVECISMRSNIFYVVRPYILLMFTRKKFRILLVDGFLLVLKISK